MNLTANKEDILIPVMDIVLYKDNKSLYIEHSSIKKRINGYEAIGYKPLTFEGLDVLLKGLEIKKGKKNVSIGFDGILPKNILLYNPTGSVNKMIWVVPGKIRNFFLKEFKGKLYYPHIIFEVVGNNIKVYTVKTLNINENTMIFKAPFPNIYTGNNICWGTLNFKKLFHLSHKQTMINIENSFFNSVFTSEMMSFNKTKNNTLDVLRKYSKSKEKFPNKELIKINTFRNVFYK